MRNTIYILFALCFLYGCDGAGKDTDKLYKEVIEIHDDAMAKMGHVARLQSGVDEAIQQLQATDSTTNVTHLQQLEAQLQEADESMMAWMRQFDNEMQDMTTEQKLEYLQAQKQQVQTVNEKLDTSIKNAEEALQ